MRFRGRIRSNLSEEGAPSELNEILPHTNSAETKNNANPPSRNYPAPEEKISFQTLAWSIALTLTIIFVGYLFTIFVG
jgi:hypothetical protein